jgi:hypothetical protein
LSSALYLSVFEQPECMTFFSILLSEPGRGVVRLERLHARRTVHGEAGHEGEIGRLSCDMISIALEWRLERIMVRR